MASETRNFAKLTQWRKPIAYKPCESVWSLGGLSWSEFAKRLWIASNEDDVYNRAYELAYNFLIAVFPLLVFLMALFGIFASQGLRLRSDLVQYVRDILPPLAYDLLRATLDEVMKQSGGGKVTFGLLLALFAGSSGTTQLISTLNIAYQVRETRSWLKVRLISVALTLVILVLIITASLLVLAGGYAARFLGSEIGLNSMFVVGWQVGQWIVALGFVLLAYATVYHFAPNLKRNWQWITPGYVAGVALWFAASAMFRLYLHYISTFSKSYGSLGAVIILLFWFQLTGLALLLGAEVDTVIRCGCDEYGGKTQKTKAA